MDHLGRAIAVVLEQMVAFVDTAVQQDTAVRAGTVARRDTTGLADRVAQEDMAVIVDMVVAEDMEKDWAESMAEVPFPSAPQPMHRTLQS